MTVTSPSRRSVAEFSSTWASLPQPQYGPVKTLKTSLSLCRPHPWINSHDPPGIPLKPNLVSFSKLKPCAPNRSHNWTILVHLLVFWVSILQVVQAKTDICLICRWQPVPVLHWRQCSKRAHRQSGFPTFISCPRQDAPRAAQATTIAPRWQTLWRRHGPFGGTLACIFGLRIWRGRRTPVYKGFSVVTSPVLNASHINV